MSVLQCRYPAAPEQLKSIRNRVRQTCQQYGLSPQQVDDVVLGVNEACMNIIQHAYRGDRGDIVLELYRHGDELIIQLTDFAPIVDQSTIKPRALDDIRPGGLGVHFIEQVMDRVVYQHAPSGCGNILVMCKKIG